MPKPRSLLRVTGGHVIDPVHDVDTLADVWIEGGRVVEPPAATESTQTTTIDARGCIVMAGAIDTHSHIAGSKVNAARLLQPELARNSTVPKQRRSRSGVRSVVPTTHVTGYTYAGLGYTMAVDAAIPPLAARHVHLEFADTPIIDKAMLVLLGNNHFVMDCLREKEPARLLDYVSWILRATHAFGVKVVDPGGVEQWKQARGRLTSLDDEVAGFGVRPRDILLGLAQAIDTLALPHPMHLHGMNLGMPGCAQDTLALLRALDGHRLHLAHVQFLSYGGTPSDPRSLTSATAALADYVNMHANVSCDIGQVVFGETTTMTADAPVGEFLHRLHGRKWVSHDVEQETGCGVVPITYSDKNFVHALQWCIGLEWFLLVQDPWKLALSTDHPNGGTFWSYPRIIAWLMNRDLRDQVIARLPKQVLKRTQLADLSRQYTLSEIAIITRAAPARILGMRDRGHLGPGARADLVVYDRNADVETMFSFPRLVLKNGQIVLREGQIEAIPDGETERASPEYDPKVIPSIKAWFDREASIAFENFALGEQP